MNRSTWDVLLGSWVGSGTTWVIVHVAADQFGKALWSLAIGVVGIVVIWFARTHRVVPA